jgi:hypothetical protein
MSDEWKPISTAPRDGTQVLLGWQGCCDQKVAYFINGRWLDDEIDGGEWHGATHWKPLDAGPPGLSPAEEAYMQAARDLNKAAYAFAKACKDTTALPSINRAAMRVLLTITDRFVDEGLNSPADWTVRIEEDGKESAANGQK